MNITPQFPKINGNSTKQKINDILAKKTIELNSFTKYTDILQVLIEIRFIINAIIQRNELINNLLSDESFSENEILILKKALCSKDEKYFQNNIWNILRRKTDQKTAINMWEQVNRYFEENPAKLTMT